MGYATVTTGLEATGKLDACPTSNRASPVKYLPLDSWTLQQTRPVHQRRHNRVHSELYVSVDENGIVEGTGASAYLRLQGAVEERVTVESQLPVDRGRRCVDDAGKLSYVDVIAGVGNG